ncbi:MAG: hypothetical protein APF76_16995 [Desulfitibacter sp. BRH_c19]|nr:MAG: hypothetical protein APF76_16995 [Desulfitibacter sp. BRH_c19]
MSIILLIVPVLIVALIVLLVVGVKFDQEKGGENVIKNVYIYLVLFATLMMTIGGSVAAFMAVADIVAPAPYYQSFEEFQRWGADKPYPDGEVSEEASLSAEELREKYDAMVSSEKERQISRAQNNLIKSFGWIVIPFPIFMFFQRRLNKKEAV